MKKKPTPPSVAPRDILRNACAALEQRLGPIEYRTPDSLRAYEGNPHKHSQK